MTLPPTLGLPDGVVLGEGVDLGGSTRSVVSRHPVLQGPHGWGRSVVVKRFVPQPEGRRSATGFAQERVGLEELPESPRLLLHDTSAQTLVMEDLGTHPTLADALLGDDPAAAWRHTLRWAGALGRTVVGDRAVLERAAERLGPALAVDQQARRDYPVRGLLSLGELGAVGDVSSAQTQIRDAVDWLEHDTARHALGPGDTCPDNAVLTPAGVRFLDLEGTGIRHLAYEAAYTAEPFSTCWCVFTAPAGLTESALDAFTEGAQRWSPGLLQDPAWPRQVRAAIAVWVLSGTLWLLDGAMADRVVRGPGTEREPRGPRFRALLVHRWRWVARECADELPAVAAACGQAADWADRAWADGSSLVLPGYPAFAELDRRPGPRN